MIASPLYDWIHDGKVDLVRDWMDKNPGQLNAPVAEGYAALQIAAMHGQVAVVSFLLDRFALVNNVAENASLTTALHLATSFRVEATASEMIQILVANGAELNAQDANRETPLHHAVARGSVRLTEELVMLGADPFLKDGQARSATDLVTALPDSAVTERAREAMRAGLKRAFSLPLE